MKKIVALTLVLIISPLANATDELSANDILSLALTSYDKREKMNTEELIGTHDGKELR